MTDLTWVCVAILAEHVALLLVAGLLARAGNLTMQLRRKPREKQP